MEDPGMEQDPLVGAQWLLRWLFSASVTAAVAFLVFGLFDGFDRDLLWARALVFGAIMSTVRVVPEIWKHRSVRQGPRV